MDGFRGIAGTPWIVWAFVFGSPKRASRSCWEPCRETTRWGFLADTERGCKSGLKRRKVRSTMKRKLKPVAPQSVARPLRRIDLAVCQYLSGKLRAVIRR